MSLESHGLFVAGLFSNRPLLTDYLPLTWEEYLALSQNDAMKAMEPEIGKRLWLNPVQRMLQEFTRIEPTMYTTSTLPTRASLDEDFKVAAAITVDKLANNVEDLYGQESVQGAARSWNHNIPQRALALLQRYERPGGRSERC